MRKEVRELLEGLKANRGEGWVSIDSGEGEVIDMIESCGYEDVEEIAKEYEKEAIKWAEENNIEIDYNGVKGIMIKL